MPLPLTLSTEVAAAKAAGRPLVALESTIITHGMPYPQNRDTALAVEAEVRAGGATPATIAVMQGHIHIGLGADALDALAQTPDAMKLSRADLAVCLASGRTGATTVAATMICAHLAGIEVFATGGIGGVHRGDDGDVSSDLTTLSREPVVVVSAGAKAILDLPRTLELLETLGVLVVGYRTAELPAFYTRSSGLPLEHRADSAEEVARMVAARFALGDRRGVLVANPIDAEHALDAALVDGAIASALEAARRDGVRGKALTPFLLRAIAAVTEQRSLAANRALVLGNCRVGAAIACALVAAAASAGAAPSPPLGPSPAAAG